MNEQAMAAATHECERLIWSLNPRSLSEQPTIDVRSWAGSVQSEVRQFGLAPVLLAASLPAPAYLKAAVVMMVKDEADIILQNLCWLHAIGVRRMIVLDNNSSDGTALKLTLFAHDHPEVELVTVHDPLVRYMQAEKTTGLYRMALSLWPDLRWVFPIDADEFLIPQRGLAVLDQVPSGIDALTIPKVIHFRHSLSAEGAELGVMERMAYRSPLFVVPPKVVAVHDPFIRITQGNHKVLLMDNRPAAYEGGFSYGFYYREFPTRSFEHFLRKVGNGGPAIRAAEAYLGHSVGGEHWTTYYDQLQAGGEAQLLEVYRREWVRGAAAEFVLDGFSGVGR
jgi:hypothetical protein